MRGLTSQGRASDGRARTQNDTNDKVDDMAKALLTSPEDQTIETVDVDDMAGIARLIGFDTLESDAVDGGSDRLFFDEECFIRGTSGRFRVDKLVPVAGKGIVVGLAQDGETLSDVSLSADGLAGRTRFD